MELRRSPPFFMPFFKGAKFPSKSPRAQTLPARDARALGADRTGAAARRCGFRPQHPCMTATESSRTQPPEAELQFDIGATDDSLERMVELFARYGDTYRVFSPPRKAYTYIVHQ